MYMIWLVIVWNGQQRPIAIPAVLVLSGEAITTAAASTRAFAAAVVLAVALTIVLAIALATFPLGHFYTCRTEC